MSGAGRTVWLLLPAKASKDPGQVFASVGGRGESGVRLVLQPPLHELLQIDLRKTQPRPSEPASMTLGPLVCVGTGVLPPPPPRISAMASANAASSRSVASRPRSSSNRRTS